MIQSDQTLQPTMDPNHLSKQREWLPVEYNEVLDECVIGGYWVKNEDCEPNRQMVECPFNSAHKMKQSKLAGHILKCEKNYPNHNKVPCYFSVLEYIDKDKIEEHLKSCPYRLNFACIDPATLSSFDANCTYFDKKHQENSSATKVQSNKSGVKVLTSMMQSIMNHNLPDEQNAYERNVSHIDEDYSGLGSNDVYLEDNLNDQDACEKYEDPEYMDVFDEDYIGGEAEGFNWSRPSSIDE